MERGRARSDARLRRGVVVLVATLVVAACSPSNPEPSNPEPSASSAVVEATPSFSAAPVPTASPAPTATPAATAPPPDRPLAGSGTIASVHADGSLWLTDAEGRSVILADAQDGLYGFPTWSPDGSRIAAIRTSLEETAIVILDPSPAASGLPVVPLPIFRSSTVGPFYLSWTPDGKDVSFLGSDSDGLALRIAPADGSALVDGSVPGAIIRTGEPFYFDWIDPDHLLAHIGTGAEAFLGEIGRDGIAVAPSIKALGTFRSADMSGDGKFLGYVRTGADGKDAVVVAKRDGSVDHTLPVFGIAAVEFSPTDDTLATIGAIEPLQEPFAVPVGPLRLIDARTGKNRTLLDGRVVSFAWSPDGTTIAAIRVVPVAAAGSASSVSPTTSPAPSEGSEIRMTFVDVESGRIRSQPVIDPGDTYVKMLLTYFDQYGLSHRLWSPDSSSLLVPQAHADGTTRVDVFFPDGDPSVSLDGEIGFWSP
jgi:WD40 repeat protein